MPRPTRVCRNPRCDDVLKPFVWIPLCPDCRRDVGLYGAIAALVLAMLFELGKRWAQ